jgi:hypothetical protein
MFMNEQVQCECGECEWVQICTEQAHANKCSGCWEDHLIEEVEREQRRQKMEEREQQQLEREYWRSRL